MLAMKPACERCRSDLPASTPGAMICSFECTFCAACSTAMDGRCPNCGGDLQARPTRSAELLTRFPASSG
ncbi:MAG: DUF1272 domain-containing protein [Alphaproteobacteria bacterium]|nr:DUF1272 domain-containing protein [Alphaproteobacteria bacterium]